MIQGRGRRAEGSRFLGLSNMRRKLPSRTGERPARLGDPAHTARVARRYGLTAFCVTILVLSPLAYGLVRAAGAQKMAEFGTSDVLLVAGVIAAIAVAAGFATQAIVHLLGHEARKRRQR